MTIPVLTALYRIETCGFHITLNNGVLGVDPEPRLTPPQRSFLQQRQAAMVEALQDAEHVLGAITAAGPQGLPWPEGCPAAPESERTTVAHEWLFHTRRIVYWLDKRYLPDQVPAEFHTWASTPLEPL